MHSIFDTTLIGCAIEMAGVAFVLLEGVILYVAQSMNMSFRRI